jgi:hypothetical protein
MWNALFVKEAVFILTQDSLVQLAEERVLLPQEVQKKSALIVAAQVIK